MSATPGIAGAVVYVKDLARMQAFYERVAGFVVADVATGHTELRSSSMQLVLVRMPEAVASSVEIGDPPKKRTDNPIKLILPVASIAAVRELAPRFGGELLPVEREWDFQHTRVCDGYDPEGNVVQFRERNTPS